MILCISTKAKRWCEIVSEISEMADNGYLAGTVRYKRLHINTATVSLVQRYGLRQFVRSMIGSNEKLSFDFDVENEDDFYLLKLKYS